MSRGRLTLLGLALGCALALRVPAQSALPGLITARSHSGQFVVTGRATASILPATLGQTVATNWVPLQPTFLSMTCERVKEALLLRLGARDRWQGQVTVLLRPLRHLDDPPRLLPTRFKDGWVYRLELPDAMDPEQLIRTLVGVLVVEWANRQSSDAPADVPLWLTEGLTQTLLAEPVLNLVVSPPNTRQERLLLRETTKHGRQAPPLAAARAYFASHEPLDFEDLCWPQPLTAPGADFLAFKHSAGLFASCLLRLRGGGASLTAMLDELGRCRNWQTAFLRAFPAHFARILDVDKWWALEIAHFLQRGDALTWRPSESLRQLDAALTVTVRPEGGPDAPARILVLPLGVWLTQTPPRQQEEALRPSVRQLEAILPRLSPGLMPLAQEYLKLLQAHQRELERGLRGAPSQRLNTFALNQSTRRLATRLAALDEQRAALASPAPGGGTD